jgi:hypothetical protein
MTVAVVVVTVVAVTVTAVVVVSLASPEGTAATTTVAALL